MILWVFIKVKKGHLEDLFSAQVLAKISPENKKINTKLKLKLLLLAMILIIIALSKPTLPNAKIKIHKELSDVVFAIDISTSMLGSDIHPNRFEFLKNKLINTLDKLKNNRIAILGFASQSFLITPLTSDKSSVKFLLKNLKMGTSSLKGTSVLSVLESANDLLENSDDKQVLLLTDGAEGDFKSEIKYALDKKIKVFVYEIASNKGVILKENGKSIKDKNNNIVIVKANPNIVKLAEKTGGKYLQYSLKNNDLSDLINSFKGKKTTESIDIKNYKQMFYYPLALAIILLFFVFFSSPRKL